MPNRLPSTRTSLLAAVAVAAIGTNLMFACGDDGGVTPSGSGGSGGATSGAGGTGGSLFQDGGPMGSSVSAGGSGAGGNNTGGEGQVGFVWDNAYSGTGAAFTKDVAVDSAGNVVVVGSFNGSFDFGGGPVTSSSGGTETNIFVAKYSSAGDFVFANTYGSGIVQSATAVAVDAQGNIGLCGFFRGSVNFGGANHNSENQFPDIFVAKLPPNGGAAVFSKSFPGLDGTTDECHGTTFDNVGNIWITGWFQRSRDFGGGLLSAFGGIGDRDVFVAKFNATGTHLASRHFGGGAFEQALGIAAAPNGDVSVVGYTEGEMNFGAGNIPNNQGRRAFAARLTSTGDQVFADIFPGDGDGTAVATAFDAQGDLYVTGNFKGGIDLGAGELAAVGANDDIFAARYDSGGTLKYGIKLSSNAADQVSGLAIDSAGYAVLAGRFNGNLAINGSTTLSTGGSFDGFIVKLGPPGNGFWGYSFGDDQVQTATGVAIGPDNTMVLVGDFSGDLDLGSGSLGGGFSQDIFVAKFSD